MSRVGAVGVKELPIGAPGDGLPTAILSLLARQVANLAAAPVEQGDVDNRRLFRLDGNGQRTAVGRPVRTGFGAIGRVRKVDRRSACRRNGEEIVDFAAGVVLFIYDPFAVGRPGSRGLTIVGLSQLDGPASRGRDLP